jgi:hypothetical protein
MALNFASCDREHLERQGVSQQPEAAVRGEVLNPTTIKLEILGGGRGCAAIPPLELHPVG